MELKKLEIHDHHLAMGAKMAPFAGYEMPVRYASELDEHKTVRSGVGVFDVSHMGEFIVEGEGALSLVMKITCNDASKLSQGQAQYSCLINQDGGVIDDLLVYRLDEAKFMLVVNASNIEKDWNWINKQNHDKITLTNISDEMCLFAIQGPAAQNVLAQLTQLPLGELKYYTFTHAKVASVDNVLISATGYTGSGGYELYFPKKYALEIWQSIMKAGEKHAIKPIGLGARDTLRLEMGFCLYGHELTDHTTPLEAGLGWIVKLNREFIGSNILKQQKEKGIEKKLVGFEMLDKGIPRQGYELQSESGEVIGSVTSGTQSPSLGVGLGMAYVNTAFSALHTKFYIKVRNRLLAAEVVKLPFYRHA